MSLHIDSEKLLETFLVISSDSLLVYKNKYYMQVYCNNCSYKLVHKRMIDYLGDNLMNPCER